MITVEVSCGSYEDCYNSYLGKAQRVELNSALYLGGLTPSLSSLLSTKRNTNLQVICMVRTRGGSFCHTELEYEQMFEDAKILLENGADGLVFGFLNDNGTIDIEHTMKMVELIKGYGKEVVIHRAFDCCRDMDEAIKTLIDLRVDRVLTGGFVYNAQEGIENLAYLQETYGAKIEILAAGGIKANNAKKIIEETKVTQVHSSCKKWVKSNTTANPHVDYSYDEKGYDCVDQEVVRELVESVQ
jgi:Uncharacterized protein involved in copper resistance